MPTANCPECDEEVYVDAETEQGDTVSCDECGSSLTVVGLDYGYAAQMGHDTVVGGAPYGATTVAGGRGERQPSDHDLGGARYLGRRVAETAGKLFG